jgi:hypothetical protein
MHPCVFAETTLDSKDSSSEATDYLASPLFFRNFSKIWISCFANAKLSLTNWGAPDSSRLFEIHYPRLLHCRSITGGARTIRQLHSRQRLENREPLKAVGALRAESQAPKKAKIIFHLPFSIFHLKRRGLEDGLKS